MDGGRAVPGTKGAAGRGEVWGGLAVPEPEIAEGAGAPPLAS